MQKAKHNVIGDLIHHVLLSSYYFTRPPNLNMPITVLSKFNYIGLAFQYNSREQGLFKLSKLCGARECLQKAKHNVIGDMIHLVLLSSSRC